MAFSTPPTTLTLEIIILLIKALKCFPFERKHGKRCLSWNDVFTIYPKMRVTNIFLISKSVEHKKARFFRNRMDERETKNGHRELVGR